METKQMYLTAGHPNRPGTVLKKVTGVVVHWTANESKGANAAGNRNYFNRGFRGTQKSALEIDGSAFRYASAHINVDDTTAVFCLPWQKGVAEMGYHVGGTYKPAILTKLGTTYPNDCTIGIEICVNSDANFSITYWNAVGMTAWMLKEHGLTIDALIRHYDVTGKLCPMFFVDDAYAKKYFGSTFNAWAAYETFRSDVKKELEASNAPAEPQYYKVYIDGAVYKYQFATPEGAEDCAKLLYRDSGGTNTSIYAVNLDGSKLYTPSAHPEDFGDLEAIKYVAQIPEMFHWHVYEELKKKFG